MDSITDYVDHNTYKQEEVEFVGLPCYTGPVHFKMENTDEGDSFQQEEMNCLIPNDDSPPEEDPLELKCNVKSEIKSEEDEINLGETVPEDDCGWKGNQKQYRQLMDTNLKKCLTRRNCEMKKLIYKCQLCSELFECYTQLHIHLQTHTCVKTYSCKYCKRSFTRLTELSNHIRIHTVEKRFTCEQCKKSFTRLAGLNMHIRIHTGEKPYSCEHCKKSFIRLDDLNKHVRIHTGEKPYSCEYCGKSFPLLHSLKYHVQSHIICR